MKDRIAFAALLAGVVITSALLLEGGATQGKIRPSGLNDGRPKLPGIDENADGSAVALVVAPSAAPTVSDSPPSSVSRIGRQSQYSQVREKHPELVLLEVKAFMRSIERKLLEAQSYADLSGEEISAVKKIMTDAYVNLITLPEKSEPYDEAERQARGDMIDAIKHDSLAKMRSLLGDEKYEEVQTASSFRAQERALVNGVNVELFASGAPPIDAATAGSILGAIYKMGNDPTALRQNRLPAISDSDLMAITASMNQRLSPLQEQHLLNYLRQTRDAERNNPDGT